MNTKLAAVKKHVSDHKVVYGTAAAVVVAGAGVYVGYRLGTSALTVNAEVDKFNIKLLSPTTNNVDIFIEALGDPGNIVQDLTTGTVYASQGQAARALGVNPSLISQHLSGKLANVKGHELTRLGKAATTSS